MPTNPNMVAIQTVTVGAGGASSITLSNIPQTYTDLVVRTSYRTNVAQDYDQLRLTFNGSSTAVYSFRGITGAGSGTPGSESSSSVSSIKVAPGVGNSATASTFTNDEIYIPNYTSSNNKSLSSNAVGENNATTAYASMFAGLWSNTAAITQITLVPESAGNFVQYSTATLYGVTSAGYGAKATGGIITSDANYYYHTFVASGTFTPTQSLTADYLVVAGGGGGGGNRGSGGGAGGLRCTVTATGGGGSLESALSLTAQAYTVTIGAGGAGSNNGVATNGSNSVFSTITSTGGGSGRSYDNGAGTSGGSGGGGAGNSGSSTPAGGAGTANQGYAGGGGAGGNEPSNYGNSGGGGGAGAAGTTATLTVMGAGGNGVATSISGSSVTYAGGGGGTGDYRNGSVAATTSGGSGGGGTGRRDTNGDAGTANTGGGGGGAGFNNSPVTFYTGGAGGSGIVIVRYAK